MGPEADRIGKYIIVERLGKGSTGCVYKASDPVIDRFVALKVIPAGAYRDARAMDRFNKEIRAQGKVMHPNVAAIFDVEQN